MRSQGQFILSKSEVKVMSERGTFAKYGTTHIKRVNAKAERGVIQLFWSTTTDQVQ